MKKEGSWIIKQGALTKTPKQPEPYPMPLLLQRHRHCGPQWCHGDSARARGWACLRFPQFYLKCYARHRPAIVPAAANQIVTLQVLLLRNSVVSPSVCQHLSCKHAIVHWPIPWQWCGDWLAKPRKVPREMDDRALPVCQEEFTHSPRPTPQHLSLHQCFVTLGRRAQESQGSLNHTLKIVLNGTPGNQLVLTVADCSESLPSSPQMGFFLILLPHEMGMPVVWDRDNVSSLRLTFPGGTAFPGLLQWWNKDSLHILNSGSDFTLMFDGLRAAPAWGAPRWHTMKPVCKSALLAQDPAGVLCG